jgi:hypothetical protein
LAPPPPLFSIEFLIVNIRVCEQDSAFGVHSSSPGATD